MDRETNGNTIRVLYVEDHKDISFPISQILTMLGYEVMWVANGQQGLEAAESWNPDIILMDLHMPVMDGPTAIRALRSNPDTADIPIFVLSAYSDAKTRAECSQLGVKRFIPKPIDVDKVDTAIKETLKHQIQEKVNQLQNSLQIAT